MDHPHEISAGRLDQLKSMAEARMETGEDTAIENAVPELVSEIFALRQQRDKLEAEKRVAIELINGENLTGKYVHKLDEAGLLEHAVHEPPPNTSGTDAVLHLYPLAEEHGDAMISANREGLRLLAGRLEQALANTAADGYYLDHGYTEDRRQRIFTADGEQYHLGVECRPAGVHDEHWQARPEPYFVSRRRARESGMAL